MTLAFRLFFRLEPVVDPSGALGLEGPVMFVGNHPNGLIDPGLVFIVARRHVTFLSKAPLFKLPVLGQILKGLDALPVYRKQDAGTDMTKNEGTLAAATAALVAGRAITIFPEGKSHSEPQLAELKTGAARIALEAARQGAKVKVVPVGFTYAEKNTYRSRVHVEVGASVDVAAFLEAPGGDAFAAAVQLTQAMAEALRKVTLNLEAWEDLPLVETAEALWALEAGAQAGDVERQKAFARGLSLLRAEQPERFEEKKRELAAFRRRLDLVAVRPEELTFRYRPATVALFALRNLLWLASLPLFALGMVLFTLPFWVPALLAHLSKVEDDVQSTVKVLTAMVLAPFWWALMTGVAFWAWGATAALVALVGVPPLALFTRVFFERRAAAVRDARVFFVLISRRRVQAQLLAEGRALAADVGRLVQEFGPRVA